MAGSEAMLAKALPSPVRKVFRQAARAGTAPPGRLFSSKTTIQFDPKRIDYNGQHQW